MGGRLSLSLNLIAHIYNLVVDASGRFLLGRYLGGDVCRSKVLALSSRYISYRFEFVFFTPLKLCPKILLVLNLDIL